MVGKRPAAKAAKAKPHKESKKDGTSEQQPESNEHPSGQTLAIEDANAEQKEEKEGEKKEEGKVQTKTEAEARPKAKAKTNPKAKAAPKKKTQKQNQRQAARKLLQQ